MKSYSPISVKVPKILYGADYNPDQWQCYPEILCEDVDLMKTAKINCVSMPIFGWAALEPREGEYHFEWLDERLETLYKNGIYTLLATPSGARPAWMDKKYPEVRRVNADRVRNLHGERHNHCYTSPVYREKVHQMNTLLAKRYGNHPGAIMWHVSNEYGGECHCELCQTAFREFLREKYHGDIEELNHAYWSYFWSHQFSSFEEIESPAPHGEMLLHGLTLDWKRFVTAQTADFLQKEVEPLKEISPHLPVTTNFMGTYPILNYEELAKHVDIISWDSYPQWHDFNKTDAVLAGETAFVHDLNRSFKSGQPFMLMESTPSCVNWGSVNRAKQPGMNYLTSMLAVAHGADTVQYFQWRKGRGGSEKYHGAVVDHNRRQDTRTFRECVALGKDLEKLDEIVGSGIPAKTAIIFDWENRWALEEAQGFSQHRDYVETCQMHYQYFHKNGIPVDIVSSACDFSKYSVMIAPMLYMLQPGVAERLKTFVANGGILVTSYFTGYVNDTDLCFLGDFPGDGLTEVLGVRVEEIDPLYDTQYNYTEYRGVRYRLKEFCEVVSVKEAEILATYQEDFYKGLPVITKNQYGQGTAYYIGARSDADLLLEFYKDITKNVELNKAVELELPEGVFAAARYKENKKYIFLMNFNEKKEEINTGNLVFYDMIHSTNVKGIISLEGRGMMVLAQERKGQVVGE